MLVLSITSDGWSPLLPNWSLTSWTTWECNDRQTERVNLQNIVHTSMKKWWFIYCIFTAQNDLLARVIWEFRLMWKVIDEFYIGYFVVPNVIEHKLRLKQNWPIYWTNDCQYVPVNVGKGSILNIVLISLIQIYLGCTGIFPTSPLSSSIVPSPSSCCPLSSVPPPPPPPIVRVLNTVSILSASFLQCFRSTHTLSPVASSM